MSTHSFDFLSDPPTLTVQAGHSKHRRTDVLLMRRDFAERVQTWIATKMKLRPGDPLFRVTDKRTAEIIRKDLTAARVQWLKEVEDPRERERLAATSFLAYENEHGARGRFPRPA